MRCRVNYRRTTFFVSGISNTCFFGLSTIEKYCPAFEEKLPVLATVLDIGIGGSACLFGFIGALYLAGVLGRRHREHEEPTVIGAAGINEAAASLLPSPLPSPRAMTMGEV